MMRAPLVILLLLPLVAGPSPRLDRGVVASPEPHASEVGAAVLRRGGNAVDAAIAIQFALAATFPNAGNLGGGGFMMVHNPRGEFAVDYRETAPAAAHRDMFLDANSNVITTAPLNTHRASGVPGSVAGMWLAHQKFGTLPWEQLLEPAIKLAAEGWTLDAWSARNFANEKRNNFADYFNGKAGDRLVQKELAATLRRIAARGRDGFYKGETAQLLVDEMKRGGGLITLTDLAGYEAKLRSPLAGRYRGLRVVSMPPPSSGGVALLQMLNMIETYKPAQLGHNRAAYVHLVAEIEKCVFADRAEYLGDPDFYRVPVAQLIAKDYAAARRNGISLEKKTDPVAIAHGKVATHESEQTTHFSVVDKWGNAVANTTTLNNGNGSGIVVRGAGFLLNNEMDDFSAKPGVPNVYGVIGRDANAIAPGKRMLSSMTPTFVFRDGKLWLVLGTPGGPTIFTTIFQVLVNRIDFDMPLAAAVAAPRFHHQWPPGGSDDPIACERGSDYELEATVQAALKALGYAIRPRGRLGDVHAVEIQQQEAIGVCDPRGVGRVAME